jgi:hypothetical protein
VSFASKIHLHDTSFRRLFSTHQQQNFSIDLFLRDLQC